ncbi:MAG: ABC transporter permease [Gammaproteobacteria bacterium]|nr:ABC transporter permease [Gammaproteobacteria bacterium]MBT8438037.1 ABC transporter permease [Gammaproteobacteria bacterium]
MEAKDSHWQRLLQSDLVYHFRRDKVAIASSTVFLILAIMALFSPVIAPFDPYDLQQIDLMDSEMPPVWQEGADERFLLGTDDQGRDLWSTILYGMRVSLLIGIFAVLLQAAIGIVIGLVSGYIGGRVDSILMRIADVQLSFSTLMVAIIVLAIVKNAFGADTYSSWAMVILILVIGLSEWPQIARTVRSSVLAEKEKEYVDAAHVMGFGSTRIMFKHILPNCMSPIFVIATLQIANAIITEAALSFLGLGMPVTEPSLGSLISIGKEYLFSGSWWITLIPGFFLVLIVIAINLMGDFLRDVFNPKLYKGVA